MSLLIGTKIFMRLLIIENLYSDLVKSRFPLGEYLKQKGVLVFYACPNNGNKEGVFDLPFERESLSLKALIKSLCVLRKIENKSGVDKVLSFRLVPNILNYFRSFFSRKKRIIVITGLGYSFVSKPYSFRKILLRSIIKGFYRLASRRVTIVSQNIDDLVELGLPKPHLVINGSGLMDDSVIKHGATEELVLLFVGRLLKSKGITEAYKLYLRLKETDRNIRLIIAGDLDPKNPDSISKEELEVFVRTKNVDYLGYVSDLTPVFLRANVLIFPSIYREGVPRVIIEALKFGLTIITYDLPGCKETVKTNGLLLDSGEIMSDRVVRYLLGLNNAKLEQNSQESRSIFLEKFCSDVVYSKYYEIIKS